MTLPAQTMLLLVPVDLRVAGKPDSTVDETARAMALAMFFEADILDTGADTIDAALEAVKNTLPQLSATAIRIDDQRVVHTMGRSFHPRILTFRRGAWGKEMLRLDDPEALRRHGLMRV